MQDSNLLSVIAGLIAYVVAILLGAGPLVYVAYWIDKFLTVDTDEDAQLKSGNRSVAIELGTTVLCQAILIRHAVYAFMAMIRSIFIEDLPAANIFGILGRSVLFILLILGLALISVQIAGKIFKKLMRHLKMEDGIRNNNVAMAIFYALVLLAITIVLNEGMEDFSRSLIPYGQAGLVNLE